MVEQTDLSVDEKGTISIPSALRARLGLAPGMTLLVEEGDSGGVRLRPGRDLVTLVDKDGILVVRAESVGDLSGAIRRERNLRVAALLARSSL
jgi:AbrB family looped-hinge helix DNA binding protein